jgi:hypothetical protein
VAMRRLGVRGGLRPATADGAVLVTVPLVLHVALNATGAVVLLILLLLLFIADIVPTKDASLTRGAWRAGLWGGLAFLAHPYGLPVVLAVTVLSNLVAAWRVRRGGEPSALSGSVRRVAEIVACTAAVVLAWATVLSVHYEELTINQAWSYNAAVMAPGSAGQSPAQGLVEPPYPGALFAWENPSTMPLVAAGWRASEEAALRILDNLASNARELFNLLVSEFLVVPVFAFAGVLVLLRRRRKLDARPDSAWPALAFAVAIYLAGSLVTFVEPQFLWFAMLAVVPLAAVALDLPILRPSLDRRDRDYHAWRLAGFALLAAGVALEAALNLPGAPQGTRASDLAARLESRAPRVAGDLAGARVASMGAWEASSVMCFHLGCTYLGQLPQGTVAGAERTRRVDYVLAWGSPPQPSGEAPPSVVRVGALSIHPRRPLEARR